MNLVTGETGTVSISSAALSQIVVQAAESVDGHGAVRERQRAPALGEEIVNRVVGARELVHRRLLVFAACGLAGGR